MNGGEIAPDGDITRAMHVIISVLWIENMGFESVEESS